MPIGASPIQEANTTATVSTVMTTVLPGLPTVGNTVFLAFLGGGTAEPTVSSIDPTGFSSWTKESNHGAGVNAHLELWRGVVSGSPSANIAVTLSGSPSGAVRCYAAEWPGHYTKDAGGSPAPLNGNSATPVTATLTPAAGVPMLMFAIVRRGGTFSAGAGNPTNGFAAGAVGTGDSTKRCDFLVIANTSGTYNTTWTYTAAAPYDTEIVAFTQNAPAGGSPYSLTAAVGAVALTGVATGFKWQHVLAAVKGVFGLTGKDAQLVGHTTYNLPADTGVFAQAAPPAGPSFVMTGRDVFLRYSGVKTGGNRRRRRS